MTLRKLVDWSLLREGFSIPVKDHDIWKTMPGGDLAYGSSRSVKFIIDGKEFDGITLKNQAFDKNKYSTHKEVIQVRYSTGSEIAKYLRTVFFSSYNAILKVREERGGKSKSGIKLSEDLQEFMLLSSTTQPDVFIVDCITAKDQSQVKEVVEYMSEEQYENETNIAALKDDGAGYKYIEGFKKVRELDRSIGDSLKQLYDYTCQMTGEKIGLQYNAEIVEAHHIVPFTESLNNDASNIIILSPNYHRIVHRTKAEFNFENLSFRFPNGLVESVKVNKHL